MLLPFQDLKVHDIVAPKPAFIIFGDMADRALLIAGGTG
jgi:hypothetical protein